MMNSLARRCQGRGGVVIPGLGDASSFLFNKPHRHAELFEEDCYA
jgi:hypothetical protein